MENGKASLGPERVPPTAPKAEEVKEAKDAETPVFASPPVLSEPAPGRRQVEKAAEEPQGAKPIQAVSALPVPDLVDSDYLRQPPQTTAGQMCEAAGPGGSLQVDNSNMCAPLNSGYSQGHVPAMGGSNIPLTMYPSMPPPSMPLQPMQPPSMQPPSMQPQALPPQPMPSQPMPLQPMQQMPQMSQMQPSIQPQPMQQMMPSPMHQLHGMQSSQSTQASGPPMMQGAAPAPRQYKPPSGAAELHQPHPLLPNGPGYSGQQHPSSMQLALLSQLAQVQQQEAHLTEMLSQYGMMQPNSSGYMPPLNYIPNQSDSKLNYPPPPPFGGNPGPRYMMPSMGPEGGQYMPYGPYRGMSSMPTSSMPMAHSDRMAMAPAPQPAYASAPRPQPAYSDQMHQYTQSLNKPTFPGTPGQGAPVPAPVSASASASASGPAQGPGQGQGQGQPVMPIAMGMPTPGAALAPGLGSGAGQKEQLGGGQVRPTMQYGNVRTPSKSLYAGKRIQGLQNLIKVAVESDQKANRQASPGQGSSKGMVVTLPFAQSPHPGPVAGSKEDFQEKERRPSEATLVKLSITQPRPAVEHEEQSSKRRVPECELNRGLAGDKEMLERVTAKKPKTEGDI